MKRYIRLLTLAGILTLVAAACTSETTETTETTAAGAETTAPPPAGGTLAQVQARGTLNCGVNDQVPGFGIVDADGNFSGFDVDFCRAVAAAVFGDSNAVNFVALTAGQRFTALQGGEIDVLIRNTTWTASRDGGEGATFLTTTFYDGQGIMVRADSGIILIGDLATSTVCSLSGTTTELNLATRLPNSNPLIFEENAQIQPAFLAGQCEGWTSDSSQLAALRSAWPEADGGPEALTILEEVFSKEPLGPVVRDGDSQWAQIIDWVVLATIQAEEFGIAQGQAGTYAGEDVAIKRLLGQPIPTEEGGEAVFDPGLGLPTDFATQVIDQVGNYGDIFERNIGVNTPLGLSRGLNALWTSGGLIYAPPYR